MYNQNIRNGLKMVKRDMSGMDLKEILSQASSDFVQEYSNLTMYLSAQLGGEFQKEDEIKGETFDEKFMHKINLFYSYLVDNEKDFDFTEKDVEMISMRLFVMLDLIKKQTIQCNPKTAIYYVSSYFIDKPYQLRVVVYEYMKNFYCKNFVEKKLSQKFFMLLKKHLNIKQIRFGGGDTGHIMLPSIRLPLSSSKMFGTYEELSEMGLTPDEYVRYIFQQYSAWRKNEIEKIQKEMKKSKSHKYDGYEM